MFTCTIIEAHHDENTFVLMSNDDQKKKITLTQLRSKSYKIGAQVMYDPITHRMSKISKHSASQNKSECALEVSSTEVVPPTKKTTKSNPTVESLRGWTSIIA